MKGIKLVASNGDPLSVGYDECAGCAGARAAQAASPGLALRLTLER
jgi:hypothetical protein